MKEAESHDCDDILVNRFTSSTTVPRKQICIPRGTLSGEENRRDPLRSYEGSSETAAEMTSEMVCIRHLSGGVVEMRPATSDILLVNS